MIEIMIWILFVLSMIAVPLGIYAVIIKWKNLGVIV